MDPVVRHLLDVSMQQEKLFQELAHSLHTVTQELWSLKHMPTVAVVPLLDPAQDAQHFLTKLNADGKIKRFLGTFKRVMEREGSCSRKWAHILTSLLISQVQWA